MMFAEVETAVAETGMFPPWFKTMLLALVVIFSMSTILYALAWKVIDKITPGNLNDEIVPRLGNKPPNVALAIIVAAFLIGFAIILGAAIVGVLVH